MRISKNRPAGLAVGLAILCLGLLTGAKGQRKRPGPLGWIGKLQKELAATKSFECDFKQTIEVKNLEPEVSTGRILVSKPDKLRWETQDGNQVQVMNGHDFWVIRKSPRRPQPVVEHMTNVDQAPTGMALRFLSGKQKLDDLYESRVIEEKPDFVRIELKPKGPAGQGGEILQMEVAKKDLSFRALRTSSGDSSTRLECQTFKRNPSFDPELFVVQE